MYTNVYGTYNKPSTAYHALDEYQKAGGRKDQLLVLMSPAASEYYRTPHGETEAIESEDAVVLEPVETAYWARLLEVTNNREYDPAVENTDDADLKDIIHMFRTSLDANRIVFVVKQDQ